MIKLAPAIFQQFNLSINFTNASTQFIDLLQSGGSGQFLSQSFQQRSFGMAVFFMLPAFRHQASSLGPQSRQLGLNIVFGSQTRTISMR